MNLGITGKIAIVTASSSGLGHAVARTLAREGANVVLFARSVDRLNRAAAEIRAETAAQVVAVAGDMRSAADVERLVDTAVHQFGGIDILVLNTGRPPVPMREVLREDDARWEEAYRVQLGSAIALAGRVVPLIVERKWGRVIAITSASVKQPLPHHALSTVFRAGVTAYMKHLANEIAGHGVTVNTVCPASIATSGLMRSYDAEQRARITPVGRLGRPEELAAAVAFLASEQAGFINGVTLPVDGGLVAGLF